MQNRWTAIHATLVATLAALWPVGMVCAAEPEVRLRLHIPAAETHVIGDAIPLYFQFENRTTNPMAFMWEGCCRFNGKLAVTRDGATMPPTPPGQALAHMFAKAERLNPQVPKDFDTRLSDWVHLTNTGTYELRGRYQGVLPFQQPQVQRGLELWRGTTDSPMLQVSLLSVGDYLAQRDARARSRGLALELSGSTNLPPLQASPFKLVIRNISASARKLTWPDSFQLWLVNTTGVRILTSTEIEATREEIELPAGAAVERSIPFDSRRIEGEPLGDYRLFVDLAAGPQDQPRVPSNPTPLRWQLTRADVAALLQQAAAGHQTGSRNAPLKLLRVYVAEIVPILDQIPLDSLSAEAARLASQLRIAGCLKPLQPKPGMMTVDVRLPVNGAWRLNVPQMAACLGGTSINAGSQLASLLSVRRHLGWEVSVNLQPDEATALLAVKAATTELAALRAELANEPRAAIALASNRVSTLTFPAMSHPANLILRVKPEGVEFARRLPNPANPARNFIPANELESEQFTVVPDEVALTALLDDKRLSQPRIVVIASSKLTWGQLLGRLRPVLHRGMSADVMVR